MLGLTNALIARCEPPYSEAGLAELARSMCFEFGWRYDDLRKSRQRFYREVMLIYAYRKRGKSQNSVERKLGRRRYDKAAYEADAWEDGIDQDERYYPAMKEATLALREIMNERIGDICKYTGDDPNELSVEEAIVYYYAIMLSRLRYRSATGEETEFAIALSHITAELTPEGMEKVSALMGRYNRNAVGRSA